MTNDKTERLRTLMAQHRLTASDVGDLLGRSAQTVREWRVQQTARPIPDTALELLTMKLAQRAAA